MVSFETSSPGKRIAYMRRATDNRRGGELTSQACRSNSRALRVLASPAAYIRTPWSPTHSKLVPLSASSTTAGCVMDTPGPNSRAATITAGRYTLPVVRSKTRPLPARSIRACET